ncbi:hypothetical protein N7512_000376 [Penicillium capsulatum]|nr:hypothetical protein N7512_000376 [Penicillium capsulatum]
MNDYHRISQRRSRFFDTREQPSPPSSDLHQGSGNAFRDLAESTQQDPWKAVGTRKYSLSSEPNHTPDLDYAAAQRLKDPKSFTQNLFDTISLRMVEWLPLRRSTESFHPSSQQSTPQLEDGRPSHQDQEQKPTHESNRLRRSSGSNLMSQSQTTHPRTPSSRHPGTQHTAVELKFPNQHLNRRSLAEVESWRHSSRSSIEEKKRPENLSRKASMNSHLSADFTMPSPPALKHRPQKHRGRIGDLDSKEKKERTKGERRVSWHSEKILNQPVPTETTQSQHPLPPSLTLTLILQVSAEPSVMESAVRHIIPHLVKQ